MSLNRTLKIPSVTRVVVTYREIVSTSFIGVLRNNLDNSSGTFSLLRALSDGYFEAIEFNLAFISEQSLRVRRRDLF